jgi:hypothetical protein
MGTRAIYTFIDRHQRHTVYKHWDGYPYQACHFIADALALAWPLPRFEADEFAAAFVAANKKIAGDVRLTSSPDRLGVTYAYEIRCLAGRLHVRILKGGDAEPIFEGFLEDARQFATTNP